jgi:acetyl-CoA acetyltransferase family protein
VPGNSVNRLCGSSLDAAMLASRAVETGDADVVVVGGVESMSRAPWVMLKPEKGFPAGHQELFSTTLGWRMVNPAMPPQWTISLGESTEKLAGMYKVDREAQDAFALRSHQLADKAWKAGFYDDWVLPVPETELSRDEGIRADTSLEKLAKLRPAFVKDGTVTAGNASPLNDGASAVLVVSEEGAKKAGREPIARIAGRGTFAVDPDIFGIGPVEAANRAVERAGIGWDQVETVELNEAFAAQSLACIGEWPIDPERVNVNGGAIAIGHPLGASGGRILGTLAYTLRANGWKYGVAAICIGVGQGLAMVLEAR